MRQSPIRLVPLLAVLASAGVSAAPIVPQVVDWSSAFSGTAFGVTVHLDGPASLITDANWVSKVFAPANVSGPRSTVEGIEFYATGSITRNYVVSFSQAVTGVVLHLGSLASTLTFDRPVTKLSGQNIFTVGTNTVSGATVNSGPYSDANASVLLGDLQSFSFTVSPYSPGGEGIGMQIVVGGLPLPPVPEPGTWALMLVGAGLLALRQQRRNTVG